MAGIDESNLRHAIKFASSFSEDQAKRLENAGMAWRTCIALLADLTAAQRRTLVSEVCSARPTSEEIRKLVHKLRGTEADARLRGDVNEAILDASRKFISDLRAFDEYEMDAGKKTRGKLVQELSATRDQLGKVLRHIRRVLWR